MNMFNHICIITCSITITISQVAVKTKIPQVKENLVITLEPPEVSNEGEQKDVSIPKMDEALVKSVGKVQKNLLEKFYFNFSVNEEGDYVGKEIYMEEVETDLAGLGRHRSEVVFGLEGGQSTCFSEQFGKQIIEKNFTFEFHILRGSYVSVSLLDPSLKVLYSSSPNVFMGNTTFLTGKEGLYQFCFNNDHYWHLDETYIYLRLEPTSIDPGRIKQKNQANIGGPELIAEITSESIYKQLRKVVQVRLLQNAYRLRMQSGRFNAMVLNKRIGQITVLTTIMMLLVGMGQTIFLKKMFQLDTTPSKFDKPVKQNDCHPFNEHTDVSKSIDIDN